MKLDIRYLDKNLQPWPCFDDVFKRLVAMKGLSEELL